MFKASASIALAGLLVLLTAPPAGAAPGDSDTGFGTGGTASVSVNGQEGAGSAVAVDPAGNIILVGTSFTPSSSGSSGSATNGQLLIARFSSVGILDQSFGSGGFTTTATPGVILRASLALTPGGRILLAVTSVTVDSSGTPTALSASIVAFTSTGAPDSTYGTNGQTSIKSASSFTEAADITVDSAGRAVVVGSGASSTAGTADGTPFVERLTPSGAPDGAFGSGGMVTLAGHGGATTAAVTSTGLILVGGATTSGITVWRLTDAGTADSTFGTAGATVLGTPAPSHVAAILPASDGSAVAVADVLRSTVVLKVTPNGTADPAFGKAGFVGLTLPGLDAGTGAAIEPDTGKVILGGLGGPSLTWTARLNPDGSRDTSFGPHGVAPATVPTGGEVFLAEGRLVRQADGKVIFPGSNFVPPASSTASPSANAAVHRFLTGSSTPVAPSNAATRIAGNDRIATAIAESEATFAGGDQSTSAGQPVNAGGVVLASADAFPDAMVGTPLAVDRDGPLLLTHTASLDPRVMTEIKRLLGDPLNGGTVTIVGGTNAVSTADEQAISGAGYQIERIAGVDRYATAAAVAANEPAGSVLEATGSNFPDGVTAGAAAAHVGAAVLLTNGSTQATPTAQFLQAHPNVARFAIGGPASMADPSATAVVGTNRYDTAAKVAQTFFITPSLIGIATGAAFADALSGGSRAAQFGAPVLLTDPAALSPETAHYLQGMASWIDSADVYGGTLAVSDAAANAVMSAIT